jgi:hypothetical protein
MHVKRIVLFGIGGAGLAAFVAASVSTGIRQTIDAPLTPPHDPVAATAGDLAAEAARLRERLTPTTTPLQPGRNLFRFNAGAPAANKLADVPIPDTSVASDVAPAPALKLVGLAADSSPEGVRRTAIISAAGVLVFATEGELVLSRFRVSSIDDDGLELVDTLTTASRRLSLK